MMFGSGGGGSSGSGSGSSSGGGGRETHNNYPGGGGSSSSYTPNPHHHLMNMNNMLLRPLPVPVPVPAVPFQKQLLSPTGSLGGGSVGGVGCDDDEFPRRDERVVQWGAQETRDFIAIRAELEGEFTVAKRNKALWESVAAKMKDLGYRRTPDQCKCKWKNLANRYKGKETSDPDNGHQFPFFDELHAVFTARENHMQQLLHESEAVSLQSGKKRVKKVHLEESSEEFLEDDDDDDDSDEEKVLKGGFAQRKKIEKEKRPRTVVSAKSQRQPITTNVSSTLTSFQEMLQTFFQQQHRIDMEWRESMEKRAKERELFEQEWRQTMEKLERERISMEQAWREREEQRRAREETRAEKREVLLTTLLKKLIQEDNS